MTNENDILTLKGKRMKTLNYPMTPEEFDIATKNDPQITQVNKVTEDEDNYKLYGLSLADFPHFKYEVIDSEPEYTLILDVPEKVQCNLCNVEFKTDTHDKCPLCSISIYDLYDKNRLYLKEWQELEAAKNARISMELEFEQPLRLYKHGQITKKTMEAMVNDKSAKWSTEASKERLVEPEL